MEGYCGCACAVLGAKAGYWVCEVACWTDIDADFQVCIGEGTVASAHTGPCVILRIATGRTVQRDHTETRLIVPIVSRRTMRDTKLPIFPLPIRTVINADPDMAIGKGAIRTALSKHTLRKI